MLHVMGCPGPVGTESRWGEATVPVLLGWSRAVAVTTLMNSACSGRGHGCQNHRPCLAYHPQETPKAAKWHLIPFDPLTVPT